GRGAPCSDARAGEPGREVVGGRRKLGERDEPSPECQAARSSAATRLQAQEGGRGGQERRDTGGHRELSSRTGVFVVLRALAGQRAREMSPYAGRSSGPWRHGARPVVEIDEHRAAVL